MERVFDARAAGVRLAAREWAGGGSDVLLLHGLASSSHIWDLVAPRLATAHRVVAYDQRGHGRSGKPSSGYGFERLRYRMDRPTTKERLAPPDLKGTPVHESLEMTPLLPPRAGRDHAGRRGGVPLADARGRRRQHHPRLSRANHLRILRALWEQDTLALLRRVRVPTLVLGVRSAPGTPDSAGYMHEKERASRLVRAIGDPVRFEWIDGIHDVQLQRPRALGSRIAGWTERAG